MTDTNKAQSQEPERLNVLPLQHLLNAGLNAFAAELLGESLVGLDSAIPVDFTLRIRKGKEFNAVRFQLTPVKLP